MSEIKPGHCTMTQPSKYTSNSIVEPFKYTASMFDF